LPRDVTEFKPRGESGVPIEATLLQFSTHRRFEAVMRQEAQEQPPQGPRLGRCHCCTDGLPRARRRCPGEEGRDYPTGKPRLLRLQGPQERGLQRVAHFATVAAAVRVEDYADTLRGYRVLHLVGKGNRPATMPLTVTVLRVLEACRGQRTSGPLVLRPVSGNPIETRSIHDGTPLPCLQKVRAPAPPRPRNAGGGIMRHPACRSAPRQGEACGV